MDTHRVQILSETSNIDVKLSVVGHIESIFKSKQDVGQFGLSHLFFSPFRVAIKTQDTLFRLEIKADWDIPAHAADTVYDRSCLLTTINRAHSFRVCLGDVVVCDMTGSWRRCTPQPNCETTRCMTPSLPLESQVLRVRQIHVPKHRSPFSLGQVLTDNATYGVLKPGVGQPCDNTAQAHENGSLGPKLAAY